MAYYAGIDVSLDSSSVCVVDETGKVVREIKVASEPDALVVWFCGLGWAVERIGMEAGPYLNGFMRAYGKRDSRQSCWRPGMCAPPSRPCLSRPTERTPVALRS